MGKAHDKLRVWGRDVDEGTRAQARRATRLPFVPGHVALMPDAHVGIGATIGSVIPTEGAVVPSFAGVDLGCGMIATETAYTAGDLPDDLGPLMSLVSEQIPAGVGRGRDLGYSDGYRDVFGLVGMPFSQLSEKQQQKAIAQFGTLGSGNHFVEVSLDERGKVWTVLHSGSRGIGNQLASYHIHKAKGLMKEYLVSLEDPDLAYFTEGTPEFDAYIKDMLWAQRYAFESRARMNRQLLRSLARVVKPSAPDSERAMTVRVINCHHNYTEREHTRAGTCGSPARGPLRPRWGFRGDPGSMGTDTYIVRGKGNPASYNSSSHGAGRRLSRGQAKRSLDPEGLRTVMKGKTWNAAAARALVDEDPRAYKDIRKVMADQSDLTAVVHVLHQVLNYKGTSG